ncbi:hypothetical protein [Tenggerimyces flavus]|uniref:Uncharacterized protein n=1 Tax=Tenggerimyces flavus TaxID=1708749 RepID=A0ABV7YL90_9ACTN|nr:hypothetical protein [Tenggerimyces flavus]MBM7790048.1 hypothetical protein [Tenggerimyces flavus]
MGKAKRIRQLRARFNSHAPRVPDDYPFEVDQRTARELGASGLEELAANLWPRDCQTCGWEQGSERPTVQVMDFSPAGFAAASLHHQRCQPAEWTASLRLTNAPLVSYFTVCSLLPGTRQHGQRDDRPVLLVNPTVEHVMLRRQSNKWMVDSTSYVKFGLKVPSDGYMSVEPVPAITADLDDHTINVRIRDTPIHWQAECPDLVADRVRQLQGIILAVSNALPPDEIPTLQDIDRLTRAGRVATGWISTEPQAGFSPEGSLATKEESGLADRRNDPAYRAQLSRKIHDQTQVEYTVSKEITEFVGTDAVQLAMVNLWPVSCQTCGDPIGAKADVTATGLDGPKKVLFSLHHSVCRSSGLAGIGSSMSLPTYQATGMTVGPSNDALMLVAVNPSCEQVLIARGRGGCRNATLDPFADVGFDKGVDSVPPAVANTYVELTSDGFTISTPVAAGDHNIVNGVWNVEASPEHRAAIERTGGLGLALLTKALPIKFDVDQLRQAFSDPEARRAWVRPWSPPDHGGSAGDQTRTTTEQRAGNPIQGLFRRLFR